jgi:hypothetical protein
MQLDTAGGLAPALDATLKHETTSMPAQKLRRQPLTDATTPELLRQH